MSDPLLSAHPLQCYSVTKAVEVLGAKCTARALRDLIHSGEVKAVRIGLTGKGYRITRRELEAKRDLILALPAPKARPEPKPKPILSPLGADILALLHKECRGDYVYFVQCGEYVKIGFSIRPLERFDTLKTLSPHPAKLLKLVSGDIAVERAIHRRLKAFHHQYEWFRFEPELAVAIKELPGRRPPRDE